MSPHPFGPLSEPYLSVELGLSVRQLVEVGIQMAGRRAALGSARVAT